MPASPFRLGEDGQGIVHVIGPELGLTLPGHAARLRRQPHLHARRRSARWPSASARTELMHVLATQTICSSEAEDACASIFDGALAARRHGQGPDPASDRQDRRRGRHRLRRRIRGRSDPRPRLEGRMTICNLSIELGAKIGMVAPDDKTLAYLHGRPLRAPGRGLGRGGRPTGARCPRMPDATFDREVDIDCRRSRPADHLGHQPRACHSRSTAAFPIRRAAPMPQAATRCERRSTTWASRRATPIAGTQVDRVFIGSCTNCRLPDLRAAAASRKAARSRRCERLGGARLGAGQAARPKPKVSTAFSATPASNGASQAARCASPRTATRRRRGAALRLDLQPQFRRPPGPGARTHLASPAMAAAAAIAGDITDVRKLAGGDGKSSPCLPASRRRCWPNVDTDMIIRIDACLACRADGSWPLRFRRPGAIARTAPTIRTSC